MSVFNAPSCPSRVSLTAEFQPSQIEKEKSSVEPNEQIGEFADSLIRKLDLKKQILQQIRIHQIAQSAQEFLEREACQRRIERPIKQSMAPYTLKFIRVLKTVDGNIETADLLTRAPNR